jgi:hypothetical protein
MSFCWAWDFPALVRFNDIPWPASQRVDAAVLRFTREHAPFLPTGEYRVKSGGYAVGMRVDATAKTVLVVYVLRLV